MSTETLSPTSRNAILALFITLAIIGTVVYAVNYLDQKRVQELNAIQTQLSTDTLSIETQFSLLEEVPCEDIAEGTLLSQEVGTLGDKLAYTENRLGSDNAEVLQLKKQYTLLQIRDYLLTKRLRETCDLEPVVALYFYSNAGDCKDCERAGAALSYLRETYPRLRVYSFDYHLELGALQTLEQVEKVEPNFPAFIIEGKRSYGFTTLEDFEKQFPKRLFATTTTNSSVIKK
jgi:hypothetical protein